MRRVFAPVWRPGNGCCIAASSRGTSHRFQTLVLPATPRPRVKVKTRHHAEDGLLKPELQRRLWDVSMLSSGRKAQLIPRLAGVEDLYPFLDKWRPRLEAHDVMLMECILNCWTHMLVRDQAYDFAKKRLANKRLALPTCYEYLTKGGCPHIFLYREYQAMEPNIGENSKYWVRLEAMRLEYEYYKPYLEDLNMCPADVYQFSRLVRAVSGLPPNKSFSQGPIVRTNCPTRLVARNMQGWKDELNTTLDLRGITASGVVADIDEQDHKVMQEKALQWSKEAFHTEWIVERPEGITVYDVLDAIFQCKMVKTHGAYEQYQGCQVLSWDQGALTVRFDFEYDDAEDTGEEKEWVEDHGRPKELRA